MNEKKWKNPNFWTALKNSLLGITYVLQTEKNLKIQTICAILAILVAVILKMSPMEWAILIITIGMVLFAEIINTSIEKTLDLYTEKYDENIKIIKDIASGAVLLTAILSVIIGCILFLPKI